MKITNYTTDDWEGYYIDGKLVAQGHNVDVNEMMRVLGHEVISKYCGGTELDAFGNEMPMDERNIAEHFKTFNG